MGRIQRSGYKQRRGRVTKKLMADVGISVTKKLDLISEVQKTSKTETLNNILRESIITYELSHWDGALQENAEKSEYISRFIKEHQDTLPDDELQAMSVALHAYYDQQTFNFDSEEETFIPPDQLQ